MIFSTSFVRIVVYSNYTRTLSFQFNCISKRIKKNLKINISPVGKPNSLNLYS